jgi:hypothetical protein
MVLKFVVFVCSAALLRWGARLQRLSLCHLVACAGARLRAGSSRCALALAALFSLPLPVGHAHRGCRMSRWLH